jgi:hypothetical protein
MRSCLAVWIRASLIVVVAGACGSGAPDSLDRATGPVSTTPPLVNLRPPITILPDGEFGDTLQIAPGQTLEVAAFYLAAGGVKVRASGATWSSSDVGVVTVNLNGVVTAVMPGVATLSAGYLQSSATRTIRVATTNGTATVRMISVMDYPVTMNPNVGVPATLAYGAQSDQVIPAGTLQLSLAGVAPITSFNDPALYGLQTFVGFLPAGAHETFVAVSNKWCADPICSGPTMAWLPDLTEAVPPSRARVRVMLAAQETYVDAYNVFITKPGEGASVVTLVGCYLDWPFSFTGYTDRDPGDLDVVLLINKFSVNASAPEAARFHVTATAGHATTFIISGSDRSSLKVLSVVDR